MANPYDDIIITDGENEYELEHIHVDNGFVEMIIKEKEKKE